MTKLEIERTAESLLLEAQKRDREDYNFRRLINFISEKSCDPGSFADLCVREIDGISRASTTDDGLNDRIEIRSIEEFLESRRLQRANPPWSERVKGKSLAIYCFDSFNDCLINNFMNSGPFEGGTGTEQANGQIEEAWENIDSDLRQQEIEASLETISLLFEYYEGFVFLV